MDPDSEIDLPGTKKRSNSDATEYPRRRATIAVGAWPFPGFWKPFENPVQLRNRQMNSARYAACARHGATELAPNANYAPTWVPNACTENQLEMAREPLRLVPNSGLDLVDGPAYVEAFFHHANVWGFKMDPDLLAELDLPHSGIVNFEEHVDLPGGFDEDDDDNDENHGGNQEGEDGSTIALRRLLNRVGHLIYQKDSAHTLSSLGPIVSELDFQLSQWYENLPRPVRFPLAPARLSNPVQTVLRLRYHACRTIIYRPYILAVFEQEQMGAEPGVRECCRRCLDATLRQLEHITSHRDGHLPYLWQGALSMVSQTLLIMGATMSPTLSTLLSPPSSTDAIISSVIVEVERYAHLAPSLKLSAEIIPGRRETPAGLPSVGRNSDLSAFPHNRLFL
ncbi:hypothetical protein N7526_011161 [Penicillium atrosanguineum]|nr:hypothetical protein N7526_011161 [Penicillium atrosanguineum]